MSNTLTDEQVENLHRAAETLRVNARESFLDALKTSNADVVSIFRGAAESYAREANAVCAAMRALGIRGVAPDFGAADFERMKNHRSDRKEP